jgi:large subunit ribosomal protein L30
VSKLRVRQVKSGLGAPRKVRRTLEALGLKHQRSVIKPDNEAVRGMLFKVKHLVEVVPESDEAEKGS